MKMRLPRQEFQEALTAVNCLIGARTTKPILACVKLSAEGEALELCASDGEATLRFCVSEVLVDEPGLAVVAADRLLGIVRELADVEIALEADDQQCVLRGEGSEFRLFVQNAADFPPIPGFGDDADVVVDGSELRHMIEMTVYAAARETSRYAFNGVLWDKRGSRLYLVATDGRRLARAGGALIGARSADFEVIVPTKVLTVFERVFSAPRVAHEGHVDIHVMPNQMLLRWQACVLSTVLIEGQFPKYDEVIPKETTRQARVNRVDLHAAIRRAALLTTEDSRAVRLTFDKGALVIRSQSPEQGQARVELPVEYEGEALEIGFNPMFVGDALKVMPYEQVCLDMHDSSRPGVLYGEDKATFLYVVMPVSLGS